MSATSILEYYQSELSARQDELPGAELPWMRRCRAVAMDRLLDVGFPTRRMEEWKYTHPALVTERPFALADPVCMGLDPEDLDAFLLDRRRGAHVVFVNGYYAPSLSDLSGLSTGVRVGSLAALVDSDPVEAMTAFSHEDGCPGHGFAELNRALWRDGAYLHLDTGVEVEQTLQLLFLTTESGVAQLIQPRNLMIVETDCRIRVVETHLALGAPSHFTNAWSLLFVEPGAHLDYQLVLDGGSGSHYLGTMRSIVAADAECQVGMFAFGGRLTRQDLEVALSERGAQCRLRGMFVAADKQYVDFHLNVRHNASATTSSQEFQGMVDDHAHGVFNGRVVVSPGMENIVSSQTTRNLLLSSHGEIDAKPQLEIHSNAVQCTHGATVGNLDEEALFYLRSRGVSETEARILLMNAFAGEILDQVEPESLRHWLMNRQQRWSVRHEH